VKTTVRRVVVAGLLTAQLVTVLLIVLASGRISSDAEARHGVALLDTAAAEAVDHTRDYLAPAGSLVATTADMIDQGTIDTAALERAFLGELNRTPQLSGVYVGTDDGSFFFVAREDGGYLVKTISIDGDERRVELRRIGTDGTRSPVELVLDDPFDPRERPWFENASLEDPRAVEWTAPYVFYTSAQLGVSASAAARSADGRLAVVGADIELGSLSDFLATLRIGATGRAVIVNQANMVIAHPDSSLVQERSDAGTAVVAVPDLDDPRARAAIGSLITAGANEDPQSTDFETPDGPGQAAFRTLAVGDETWTVAVHADRGAFVQGLSDARGEERLLMIAVGLISVILLAVIAFPATRSLTRLERRATLDALTGLLNRGTILDQGAQIANRAGLHAAIMIDLDRFKLINDTHGHQVGDEVIHEVGQRIMGALRSDDRAGRIGGEEFLVVLGATTPSRAREVADRIRRSIRGEVISTTVGPLEITASVGLGLAVGPTTLQRTLAVADTALMEAKHEGRDQVVSGGLAGETASARRGRRSDRAVEFD
jgi:diguanylate cyclase (GGDEF)-like protein